MVIQLYIFDATASFFLSTSWDKTPVNTLYHGFKIIIMVVFLLVVKSSLQLFLAGGIYPQDAL